MSVNSRYLNDDFDFSQYLRCLDEKNILSKFDFPWSFEKVSDDLICVEFDSGFVLIFDFDFFLDHSSYLLTHCFCDCFDLKRFLLGGSYE